MSLKNTYIVEKSNILNEIRSTKMSLQELRFFSIYLAKINARDASTRCVRFPLSDFQKIMGIGRMNIKHFKTAVNGLLCKVVHMPTDKGGLSSFQLFKEVDLFKDDSDLWVVEIDAHDKALPLLFNLKKNYFTYELWNALRLKSVNQLRMYELLKQHEHIGNLEVKVSELREYLFIAPDQYSALKDFRIYVINSCQKALAKNTDISFTYEKGKVGNRGKWLTIVFHISKNTNYTEPIQLDEFIDKQPAPQPEDKPQAPEQYPEYEPPIPTGTNRQASYEQPKNDYSDNYHRFLASACNFEFTESQIDDILSMISTMPWILSDYRFSDSSGSFEFAYYHYIQEVYSRLNVYADAHEVHNRYALFRKFVDNDRKERLSQYED